jgi:hypothetical protein
VPIRGWNWGGHRGRRSRAGAKSSAPYLCDSNRATLFRQRGRLAPAFRSTDGQPRVSDPPSFALWVASNNDFAVIVILGPRGLHKSVDCKNGALWRRLGRAVARPRTTIQNTKIAAVILPPPPGTNRSRSARSYPMTDVIAFDLPLRFSSTGI